MRPDEWKFIRIMLIILGLGIIAWLLVLGMALLTSYVVSIMPTALSTFSLILC